MTSQPIYYEDYENMLSVIQGELLEALLQPDEDFYPWNPAEPEAEPYFAEVERGFVLSDWQEEAELEKAAGALFSQLQQCWSSSHPSAIDDLKRSLSERFSAFMPQAWLEAIANKAQQMFQTQTNLSLAEQIVGCVQPLLPQWAEDDLFVLARPLAGAMRGPLEPVGEELPSSIRLGEWTELSQIEQARLSLAVARSALFQLRQPERDAE